MAAKVQFIKTPAGEELAILPRADFESMQMRLEDAREDKGTARLVKNALNAIEEGTEVVLPQLIADRLAVGENPIRLVREWRDMSQVELATAVGIGQGYLSDLENGRRRGPAALMRKLARALAVPLDLLVP